tara:strand:+ start:509 stop:688 length:180 start_codon:yes stop_codon:yes gene_type:complete
MPSVTRSAMKTVNKMSDITDEVVTRLRDSLVLIDHPEVSRVIVEVRVKQVFDEEAPEGS